MHWAGGVSARGCLPGGVCLGGCLPGGVFAHRGVCLPTGGGCLPGGYLPRGGEVSAQGVCVADTPPVDRQAPVKT